MIERTIAPIFGVDPGFGASDRNRTDDIQDHNLAL